MTLNETPGTSSAFPIDTISGRGWHSGEPVNTNSPFTPACGYTHTRGVLKRKNKCSETAVLQNDCV